MKGRLTVTIAPTRDRVRILATALGKDVLKAVLPPVETAHRRAVTTLLEALALWHGQPVSVVLSADDSEPGFAMGFSTDSTSARARSSTRSPSRSPILAGRRRAEPARPR